MTDKVTTTLEQIRDHSPCEDGWKNLYKNLGGFKAYGEDTPLTFKQIYDSNGYDDTLWCLRSVDKKFYPLLRHFAVDCAEQVKHLMTDKRSLNALVVARLHADGKATDEELAAAKAAAWDAAKDAAWDDARAAARDAQMELLFEYCRTGKRACGALQTRTPPVPVDKCHPNLDGKCCKCPVDHSQCLENTVDTIAVPREVLQGVMALRQAIEDIWPTLQKGNSSQGLTGDKVGWIMEVLDDALNIEKNV